MADGTWQERAALGERLAIAVVGPSIDERIVALLLDPEDSAVTFRTAIALIERGDTIGIQHVVHAAARGDDSVNDWIGDAFTKVRSDALGTSDDSIGAALAEVRASAGEAEAAAAAELLSWLFAR